jgi:hypothetical protein
MQDKIVQGRVFVNPVATFGRIDDEGSTFGAGQQVSEGKRSEVIAPGLARGCPSAWSSFRPQS